MGCDATMKYACAPGSLLSAPARVMLDNLMEAGRVMGQAVAHGPSTASQRQEHSVQRALVILQLEDITEMAGIHFTHSSARENRRIVESMNGGGYCSTTIAMAGGTLYFTSALMVDMAVRSETAGGGLYRNNRDFICESGPQRISRGSKSWDFGMQK